MDDYVCVVKYRLLALEREAEIIQVYGSGNALLYVNLPFLSFNLQDIGFVLILVHVLKDCCGAAQRYGVLA